MLKLCENCEPVVGILAIDIWFPLNKHFGENYKSYIAGSYVKFVENCGGRVVPIWIAKDEIYYRNIMAKIDGILIPGGCINLNDTENGKAAFSCHIIYKIAVEFNRSGKYFPIFGICLGFELLVNAASGSNSDRTRVRCKPMKKSIPLELANDFRESKIFHDLPDDYYRILTTESVTYHLHMFCITKQILLEFNLAEDWRIVGLNHDDNTFEFISIIEHKSFPFYGVQFHPEKPQFEGYLNDGINHSSESIQISQYFGEFLIQECHKNGQVENSNHNNLLIKNFPISYTGEKCKSFKECYLFDEDIDYPK